MTDTESGLEELFSRFAEPKQILFLSADLVGSTALKQKKRKPEENRVHHPDTQEWASTIQFFFTRLNQCFDDQWSKQSEKIHALRDKKLVDVRLGTKPILWKMIGDELVYRKYVSHRHQVKQTIDIWIAAVEALYRQFDLELSNPEISIKCTAWIGEFPIQNKVLVGSQFSGQPGSIDGTAAARLAILHRYEYRPVGDGIEIDFIGPAIDIGFRLARKATPRKFILSIDTLFLYVLSELSGNITEAGEEDEGPAEASIYFDGSEPLPGVLGGLPYPIFWIDMASPQSSEVLTDAFVQRQPVKRRREILNFCKAFYKEQRCYIDRPYIATDKSVAVMKIDQKPDWYDAEREKLRRDMLGPRRS